MLPVPLDDPANDPTARGNETPGQELMREALHGFDERVFRPSVVQTAQVLALFITDWCGWE